MLKSEKLQENFTICKNARLWVGGIQEFIALSLCINNVPLNYFKMKFMREKRCVDSAKKKMKQISKEKEEKNHGEGNVFCKWSL